jgi:ATP-dependent RNA helicase DDX56/DBP9
LPLLQKILQDAESSTEEGVRAVILVPTRELCTQVFQTLQMLTYYCDEIVSLAVLSGGRANSEKEKQELARQEAMLRDLPKVIVATPAGLLTHIRSGVLDLTESVETLVVDEADLVLSFGAYS